MSQLDSAPSYWICTLILTPYGQSINSISYLRKHGWEKAEFSVKTQQWRSGPAFCQHSEKAHFTNWSTFLVKSPALTTHKWTRPRRRRLESWRVKLMKVTCLLVYLSCDLLSNENHLVYLKKSPRSVIRNFWLPWWWHQPITKKTPIFISGIVWKTRSNKTTQHSLWIEKLKSSEEQKIGRKHDW